jgi:2-iminobutanoate/2-iminopropanoate deaminase
MSYFMMYRLKYCTFVLLLVLTGCTGEELNRDSKMNKRIIQTSGAPAPIGPYSQAVAAGNMLFISGQIAIDPASQEYVPGTPAQEAERAMLNIKAILDEAGTDFGHVIKTTIFLRDMAHFGEVNQVYSRFFAQDFPARETVAVAGLPKNAMVEISMTVLIP